MEISKYAPMRHQPVRDCGMHILVERYTAGAESTLGRLHIDGVFACYTCEDQRQPGPKVPKETRIPAGTYALKLRWFGGKHQRYSKLYADIHRGMLWLQDVPGFEDVLIHVGNTDRDSEGCLLVGFGRMEYPEGGGEVLQSKAAYRELYPRIAEAIEAGETVRLEIVDRDGTEFLIS